MIDASVLNDGSREILAVQRRMANKAKYVPDLEGSPWPDPAVRSGYCTRKTRPVSARSMPVAPTAGSS